MRITVQPPEAGRPPDEDERTRNTAWLADIVNAVAALDEITRRALQLVYFRGLTQTQAARELRVAESTLRHKVAQGLQKVADALTNAS